MISLETPPALLSIWIAVMPALVPATLKGTPAAITAKLPPHAVAIEELPLDSSTSDTTRIVYGKSPSLGSIGESARSASAPWPISRRDGARRNFTSPVENGGKL